MALVAASSTGRLTWRTRPAFSDITQTALRCLSFEAGSAGRAGQYKPKSFKIAPWAYAVIVWIFLYFFNKPVEFIPTFVMLRSKMVILEILKFHPYQSSRPTYHYGGALVPRGAIRKDSLRHNHQDT